MVVDLWVEIALHDILLIVTIVCACLATWGIGNLHQTAAVEEGPCPSAVGSMSPGAAELVVVASFFLFLVLVLISVEIGLYLVLFANVELAHLWPALRPKTEGVHPPS